MDWLSYSSYTIFAGDTISAGHSAFEHIKICCPKSNVAATTLSHDEILVFSSISLELLV